MQARWWLSSDSPAMVSPAHYSIKHLSNCIVSCHRRNKPWCHMQTMTCDYPWRMWNGITLVSMDSSSESGTSRTEFSGKAPSSAQHAMYLWPLAPQLQLHGWSVPAAPCLRLHNLHEKAEQVGNARPIDSHLKLYSGHEHSYHCLYVRQDVAAPRSWPEISWALFGDCTMVEGA